MTKYLLRATVVAVLTLSAGCAFSKKKPTRTTENSAIASDVEETFRKRWLDKRIGELVAQGTAAEVARTQADGEFREKFGFNQASKK